MTYNVFGGTLNLALLDDDMMLCCLKLKLKVLTHILITP